MYSHIFFQSADTVREQQIHSIDPRDPFRERTCNLCKSKSNELKRGV